MEVIQGLEGDKFDLILLDVEMPQMDGFEATHIVRQREVGSNQHIPILAVTAYAAEMNRERCLEMGMDGYLSKPFIHEKLNEVLKPFLPTASEGALAAPIDLNATLKAVSGSAEFLREAVGVFLEQDYPRHVAALQEGIARHEARAVQRAAHGLQGPLSGFGCRAAVEIARHLEKMAREGNLDGVSSALEELELEANRAASYIGTLLQNELEPTTG